MNRQKKDKIRAGIMVVISMAVIATAALFAIFAGIMEDPMVAIVTLILVGTAAAILIIALKAMIVDINKGIPLRDERTQRIMEKSAASTFIFMIYFLLALGWYSDMDDVEILPRHISATAIVAGSVFLFAMFGFYSWRGVDL